MECVFPALFAGCPDEQIMKGFMTYLAIASLTAFCILVVLFQKRTKYCLAGPSKPLLIGRVIYLFYCFLMGIWYLVGDFQSATISAKAYTACLWGLYANIITIQMSETASHLVSMLPPYDLDGLKLSWVTAKAIKWIKNPRKRRITIAIIIIINFCFSLVEGSYLGNNFPYRVGYVGETISSLFTTALLTIVMRKCRTLVQTLKQLYMESRKLLASSGNKDFSVPTLVSPSQLEGARGTISDKEINDFIVRMDTIDTNLKVLTINVSAANLGKIFGLATFALQFDHDWVRITFASMFFVVLPTSLLLNTIKLGVRLARVQDEGKSRRLPGHVMAF